MTARMEAWLYGTPEAAMADAVGITITEPGPTVYISRLLAPARLSDALTAWAADMTANLTGTYSLTWDADAQAVTISASGVASFSVSFGGNIAAALGFSASSGHTGALTYTGDQQALARFDALHLSSLGVVPSEDVEVHQYEQGRYRAIAWSQVDVIEGEVRTTRARMDALVRSYCAAGQARVYMDEAQASAYSASVPGGYVDGMVVFLGDVEHSPARGLSTARVVIGRGR